MTEPEPLAASLDRVLRSLGAPSAAVVTTVFTAWPQVVGERIAAHSRPVRVESGVLTIVVTEPGWATELRYQEAALLQRLADALGSAEITGLEVRVRPPPSH